jgi:hypothetical protein
MLVTHVPATLVEMDQKVLIPVTNFGTQVLYIGSDTPLAALKYFSFMAELPDSIARNLPKHLQALFEQSMSDLPNEEDKILLNGYADVFIGLYGQLGPTEVEHHKIDSGTQAPFKQRPYRMSEVGHHIVEKECQKMLEKGVIKESNSPWSSLVVLVAKKNGEV